jgi:glycyl-tRNA synthetase beta chain
MQTNNFIFEIGVDEIPAQYVEEMAQSFENVLSTAFVDNLLEFSSIKVNYTPRRLVAIVEDLSAEQKVNEEEVKGPSLDRAYDQNNNPTPALLGFLKGKNKNYFENINKFCCISFI